MVPSLAPDYVMSRIPHVPSRSQRIPTSLPTAVENPPCPSPPAVENSMSLPTARESSHNPSSCSRESPCPSYCSRESLITSVENPFMSFLRSREILMSLPQSELPMFRPTAVENHVPPPASENPSHVPSYCSHRSFTSLLLQSTLNLLPPRSVENPHSRIPHVPPAKSYPPASPPPSVENPHVPPCSRESLMSSYCRLRIPHVPSSCVENLHVLPPAAIILSPSYRSRESLIRESLMSLPTAENPPVPSSCSLNPLSFLLQSNPHVPSINENPSCPPPAVENPHVPPCRESFVSTSIFYYSWLLQLFARGIREA
ncbi:leucine-rich repeat extensin-like protein 3 [Penaeus japonicus]|uniref:leucine-rich repeat extensin-like protein 3 n=1 Tax=Penaeus japonicus TaxID=27405 RepID=UPI001C7114A2|nr:leucine-rich repeat extensin-like protein 3 [Penaeus japonicus]